MNKKLFLSGFFHEDQCVRGYGLELEYYAVANALHFVSV